MAENEKPVAKCAKCDTDLYAGSFWYCRECGEKFCDDCYLLSENKCFDCM